MWRTFSSRRRAVQDLKAAIVRLLEEHHRAQPLSDGVPREEARERLFRRGHAAVFERVVDDLAAAGTVTASGRLALARHRTTLSPEEERARTSLDEAVRAGGLTPPDLPSLVSRAQIAPAVAERVVQLLVRQKRLVKLDTLLFHEETLRELKERVLALKTNQDVRIDVTAFKERFGVTRKFAIPLLEYLDRERVTRRVGESRVIL